MPEYLYTARTPEGRLKKDRFKAKNEKGLSDYLKSQGLILTTAKEIKKGGKISIQNFLNNLTKVSTTEKIFFTQNLSIMVKTGFSLAQALRTLSLQTDNKKFKEIILDIQRDVESGISFSNALGKHETIFSELFVNMIAAGEVSGKLDEILQNLTKQMKKDHALMSKVRTALMYPSVVVFAMLAIGTIMMITVIPQLTEIFSEAGAELPLPTVILMTASDILASYGIYILIALAILAFAFMKFKRTKKGKLIIHSLLLRMPVFASILKKINIARFTRTLSSLLKTDIPIVQTLQIISKTLGNIYYQQAMLDASEKVKKGISIAKTLEEQPKLFQPVVTQMINIGEESGTLDTISDEIADFYEEDVSQSMSGLSSVIEPILMLVIGAAVAGLALAVLMPMYGLVETL